MMDVIYDMFYRTLLYELPPDEIKCQDIPEKTDDGVPIRKLFIGNLAERTTINDLRKLFTSFGDIDNISIKRNINSRNFAFVTFKNVDGGVKARTAEATMQIKLHGRVLRISPADSWHQPDRIDNRRKYLDTGDYSETDLTDDSMVEFSIQPDFSQSPIYMLNNDCLIEIFLRLPIADRVRIERVCKRWRAVSQMSWKTVKSLDLAHSTWGLSPKIRLQFLDTCTLRKILIRCGRSLTNLDLSQTPHALSPSTITLVGKLCPNLQSISVSSLKLSPAGIYSMKRNCQNIKKFTMESLTGPCERDLTHFFQNNKKLKYVAITGDSYITGACLSWLNCDTIEEVHLELCPSLQSSYLNLSLENWNHIHSLTLNSCVCIIDSTLKSIGKMKTIINLKLSGEFPMISHHAMNHLANLTNLQHLDVSSNSLVTDNFLNNISKNCKKLKSLDVSYCNSVTNDGIAGFENLPELEILKSKYYFRMGDEQIGNIKHHNIIKLIKTAPNLKTLNFSLDPITNHKSTIITITIRREDTTEVKIIVDGNDVTLSEIHKLSPSLQVVDFHSSRIYIEYLYGR